MRIVLRALRLTRLIGLAGAVALTFSFSSPALGASASGPSGWRIATTLGSASSQVGDADLAVSGTSDAWAAFTCGPCPSGSQPHQNLMLHWNGKNWSPVTLPASLRNPAVLAGLQASSASNLWAFTDDHQAVVFNGSHWAVRKLPAWVERPVSGNEASVGSAVFSPTNVWAFSLEATGRRSPSRLRSARLTSSPRTGTADSG